MFTVWTFYFGLTKFQLGSKGLEILTENVNDKKWPISEKRVINKLRCAFESQQVVCDEVVKQINGSLVCYDILTPSDLQAIVYVISTTSQPVTELSIGNVHCTNGITILLKRLTQIDLSEMKSLKIISALYSDDLNVLANILKSATNLKELALYFENISLGDAELGDTLKPLIRNIPTDKPNFSPEHTNIISDVDETLCKIKVKTFDITFELKFFIHANMQTWNILCKPS